MQEKPSEVLIEPEKKFTYEFRTIGNKRGLVKVFLPIRELPTLEELTIEEENSEQIKPS